MGGAETDLDGGTRIPHSPETPHQASQLRLLPEGVVPRNQVGEGEDGGVGGDLLLPQGTFDLLPVPRHHLVVVGAL